MKEDLHTILDRYLTRHGEPRREDADRSIERVWRELAPGAVHGPALQPGASMPRGRTATIAAAAAVALVSTVLVRQWTTTSEPLRATVESVDGSAYRLAEGHTSIVRTGAILKDGEIFRTNGGAGALLVLADGSRVEMRSQSELFFERAEDGVRIRLRAGGIIVSAAKQPIGHLYVQTKDVTVSVVGTVFLVNAEEDGSRVAVIEGEVRVHEGTTETRLRPGEQVATNPRLEARPVKDDIAWSRHADALGAILDSFSKGMAATAAPLSYASRSQAGGASRAGTGSPQFEEASIRLCDPDNLPEAPAGARGGGANSFQMTPGRVHALCMTAATLIRTAYGYSPANIEILTSGGGRMRGMAFNNVYGLGVEDGLRVRGGPDWVRQDRYSIEAIADPSADVVTMQRTMLRALIDERFQLKVHIETEQIPAFAMTIAKGGLKMKEGTCIPDPPPPQGTPLSTRGMVARNLDAARRGETTHGLCGLGGTTNGPNQLFVGAGTGVPLFSGQLGVPVINRTGIPPETRFNFVFEFAPDENTPGPIPRPPAPADQPSDIPKAANIFTALEEQLGLKLEPAKAPREFIVIDSISRPKPN